MSDEDDFPTPTESDPISDVNPDEMDKLMADLDDMDNDLFKSESKPKVNATTSKTLSPPSKKDSKKVTFGKDIKSNAEDDWDSADDLLDSGEEKAPVKHKGEEQLSTFSSPPNPLTSTSKSPTASSNKSLSPVKPAKPDKSKLVSDLFDTPKTSDSEKLPKNEANTPKAKKGKENLFFDDDSDPLNVKGSGEDSGYLDNLLGKSSVSKPEKKASVEFSLPDQYKSFGMDAKSQDKRGGRSGSSDPFDDFFTDAPPRTGRRGQSQRTKPTFDIDDDDILGGIKNKTKQSEEANVTSKSQKTSKKDDWLFGSPKGTPPKMKEVTEAKNSKSPSASPQKEDWMNQLLTSKKGSPSPSGSPATAKASGQKSLEKEAPVGAPPQPVTAISSVPQMYAANFAVPASIPQTALINPNTLPLNFATNFPNQLIEQQVQMQAGLSAMTAQLKAQRQEAESLLLQQFQIQMQEQMQKMSQILALQSFPAPNLKGDEEQDESVKQLKIDLHKAQAEVGGLEAELAFLKEQHKKEIEVIRSSYQRKESLAEEVWKKKEESMIEEKQNLIQNHEMKMKELQREKELLAESNAAKLSNVKSEMGDALQRAKEMYSNVIERMKKEQQNAIDRLTELKGIELKAAVAASGQTKEVESVLTHLETNTADLNHLTAIVNEKHQSALVLTRKSLELKEKQLKEMETNLGLVRAESESERNRLTVLVNRLETTLANQGTEVESQKWVMAQEKMKLDAEKGALLEEKRHFQLRMENERREFVRIKESFVSERKEMLETIAKQKSRIYDELNRKTRNLEGIPNEMEILQLKEDKKILEEKISSLRNRQMEMIKEEEYLEKQRLTLEEENMKNLSLKEIIDQKTLELERQSQELERREQNLEDSQRMCQRKLSEITQATQNLHSQQEAILKDKARLELERENNTLHFSRGLCPSCSSKLGHPKIQSISRIPGDGSEMLIGKSEAVIAEKRFDPASVLQRLKAAQEIEQKMKKRKEQISGGHNS